jgi:hypothetical protein
MLTQQLGCVLALCTAFGPNSRNRYIIDIVNQDKVSHIKLMAPAGKAASFKAGKDTKNLNTNGIKNTIEALRNPTNHGLGSIW